MSGLKILVPIAAVILVIFGVLLVMLKIVGTGGNNGATSTPGSRATDVTPASPTALGANWKTATPQPAASRGRTDCPGNWASFAEPDGTFSICFPSEWSISVDVPHAAWSLGWTLSLGNLGDVGMLIIYGRASSYFTPGADRCGGAPYADHWTDLEESDVWIGGAAVRGCRAYYLAHFAGGAPPQRNTVQFAELPAETRGRYVEVTLMVPENETGRTASATWENVLATFRR